jgi:hypothetical protein
MKKLLVLAMMATLLMAGSAFAVQRTKVTPNATFSFGAPGIAVGPTTTNNDDSCDIGTAPAATLLLPYFEVDVNPTVQGQTTLFTITNVSRFPQIAHVTVWTDWSFPVLDFNIFLTGYDVQPINLFDIISRGFIGGTTGTGIGSSASPNARATSGGFTANQIAGAGTTGTNPNIGSQPFRTTEFNGNTNFLGSASTTCVAGRLPGTLPAALATDVRALLTTGRSTGVGVSCPGPSGEAQVGGNHGGTVAIGYATIDVAATCSVALPIDPAYFTGEILFDNVLIGDYQDVNQSTVAGNYAGGNPLVHIRAIPEGGAAGVAAVATNLPFTFYDRYLFPAVGTARTADRRQPLPSGFAARWISGTGAAFDTQYKIWREGFTTGTGAGGASACTDYVVNSAIPLVEVVRFDEHENAGVAGVGVIVSPPTVSSPTLPEAARVPITSSLFPTVTGGSTDAGGWNYFNLSNGGDAFATTTLGFQPYNSTRPGFGTGVGVGGAVPGSFARDVSQNWVILSMFAEGRYGVDQDANWLGNGCSPALPASSAGTVTNAIGRIAPAGGVLVCAPPNGPGTGTAPSAISSANGQCTGSNVTP